MPQTTPRTSPGRAILATGPAGWQSSRIVQGHRADQGDLKTSLFGILHAAPLFIHQHDLPLVRSRIPALRPGDRPADAALSAGDLSPCPGTARVQVQLQPDSLRPGGEQTALDLRPPLRNQPAPSGRLDQIPRLRKLLASYWYAAARNKVCPHCGTRHLSGDAEGHYKGAHAHK